MILQDGINSELLIDDLVLILLLFADDMVIFGETPEDRQHNLDLLLDYCNTWSLEVNASKTKLMVFRKRGGLKRGGLKRGGLKRGGLKRGGLKRDDTWTYKGVGVEVVDSFNYLVCFLHFMNTWLVNHLKL